MFVHRHTHHFLCKRNSGGSTLTHIRMSMLIFIPQTYSEEVSGCYLHQPAFMLISHSPIKIVLSMSDCYVCHMSDGEGLVLDVKLFLRSQQPIRADQQWHCIKKCQQKSTFHHSDALSPFGLRDHRDALIQRAQSTVLGLKSHVAIHCKQRM